MVQIWHEGPEPPNQNWLVSDFCKLVQIQSNLTHLYCSELISPCPSQSGPGGAWGRGFLQDCHLGPGVGLKVLSPGINLQGRGLGEFQVVPFAFTLSKGLSAQFNKPTALQKVRALTLMRMGRDEQRATWCRGKKQNQEKEAVSSARLYLDWVTLDKSCYLSDLGYI